MHDLKPDPQNARKHTPRNVAMVVDALQELGAARSIVLDEKGIVLAGNATIKAASRTGLARVKGVDTGLVNADSPKKAGPGWRFQLSFEPRQGASTHQVKRSLTTFLERAITCNRFGIFTIEMTPRGR